MIASRRRGAALVSGLAVGALLVGGTVIVAQATSPPPRETADLALPLLPVPTLPMPIVPILAGDPGAVRAARRPPSRSGKGRPRAPAGAGERRRRPHQRRADRAGCGALRFDSRLAAAARAHSADMVNRHYFAHESPDGSTPADRAAAAGYTDYGGENIA